jgi:ubiquinone biosynthesis protein UbiJ
VRALAQVLETALNGYLRLDPDTQAKLTALSGKAIRLELSAPTLNIYLVPGPGGVRVLDTFEGAVDASIRASPLALLRLSRGDLAAEREIHLQGDVHTVRTLRRLLREIDIDWEEQLSKLIGDIPAHQIGSLFRAVAGWNRQALDKFRLDTAEYLQYERRELPPRHAVEQFLDAVDRLRADTDRLEARIERLQRAASGAPAGTER